MRMPSSTAPPATGACLIKGRRYSGCKKTSTVLVATPTRHASPSLITLTPLTPVPPYFSPAAGSFVWREPRRCFCFHPGRKQSIMVCASWQPAAGKADLHCCGDAVRRLPQVLLECLRASKRHDVSSVALGGHPLRCSHPKDVSHRHKAYEDFGCHGDKEERVACLHRIASECTTTTGTYFNGSAHEWYTNGSDSYPQQCAMLHWSQGDQPRAENAFEFTQPCYVGNSDKRSFSPEDGGWGCKPTQARRGSKQLSYSPHP